MLRLTVDAKRWRTHLRLIGTQCPGLVPVAKGNGYGFGNALLAREAMLLGCERLAVGIAQEVECVRAAGWAGEIVVLNPWRPFDAVATALLNDHRVITTVSRSEDLRSIGATAPGARILVEVETTMHRHGISERDIPTLNLSGLDVVGWTIHLPAHGSLDEARRLAEATRNHAEGPKHVWFSHLAFDDYRALHTELDGLAHLRVGTRLWLGSKEATRVTGTVLDVHRLKKGTVVGYHGSKLPADGCVVVVSGGTAHGVALAACATPHSLKQRLIPIAEALDEVRGRVTSPFTIAGKKQPFAEPPHMHSSMLFVAGPGQPVHVGDEVPVNVRMTTTIFDEVRFT